MLDSSKTNYHLLFFLLTTLFLISCIVQPETPDELAKQTDLERLNLKGPVKSVLIEMDVRGIGKHKIALFEFNEEEYKTIEEHYNNSGTLVSKTEYEYPKQESELVKVKHYIAKKDRWNSKTISLLERDISSDQIYFQNKFPNTPYYQHRLEKDEYGNVKEIEYLRVQQYSNYHIKIEKTETRQIEYYGKKPDKEPKLLDLSKEKNDQILHDAQPQAGIE